MCELIFGDLQWEPTDCGDPDVSERYVAFTHTWCCWLEFRKSLNKWTWGVSSYGDCAVATLAEAKAAVDRQVMI